MSKVKENSKLTDRQLKAIPHIVSCSTYTEGCKKAKINKTTYYKWLKDPEFKAELDKKRNEVVSDAFGILSQGLTKAVENLVELLDHTDDRLKRMACKDIIEYVLKHKEIEDIDERLTAIEQRLSEQK